VSEPTTSVHRSFFFISTVEDVDPMVPLFCTILIHNRSNFVKIFLSFFLFFSWPIHVIQLSHSSKSNKAITPCSFDVSVCNVLECTFEFYHQFGFYFFHVNFD